MSQRFFVESPIVSTQVTLSGNEAHHLARVRRIPEGQVVTLFDGNGGEYSARVTRIERHGVQLIVLSQHDVERELPVEITLAVALPKGERQRWLIEKAVELGVARVIPLAADRAVAQPTSQALRRLHRHVIEASKQCGRNRLMKVETPQTIPQLIAAGRWQVRLIAQPGAPRCTTWELNQQNVVVAIGPEGGFTDAELQQVTAANWSSVGLGPAVLRIETAALSITAQLAAACDAPPDSRPPLN